MQEKIEDNENLHEAQAFENNWRMYAANLILEPLSHDAKVEFVSGLRLGKEASRKASPVKAGIAHSQGESTAKIQSMCDQIVSAMESKELEQAQALAKFDEKLEELTRLQDVMHCQVQKQFSSELATPLVRTSTHIYEENKKKTDAAKKHQITVFNDHVNQTWSFFDEQLGKITGKH